MPTKKTETPVNIEIPPLQLQTVQIPIVGTSPLCLHAWSEKAKKMILDKQMKKAVSKKEAKSPEEDFDGARYVSTEGWDGIPAVSFERAAVGAVRTVEGLTMVLTRGAIRVEPEGRDAKGTELVRIKGDEPEMREDMVRVGMGKADIRYRPFWQNWAVNLTVAFDPTVLSAEQIVNLFNRAGWHCGIGEGRPSAPKTPMGWGRFKVSTNGGR